MTNWREWSFRDWVAVGIVAAVIVAGTAYSVISSGLVKTVVQMFGGMGIIVAPAVLGGLLLWIVQKILRKGK